MLPRWARSAGFGLLLLLVVLAWVQSGAAGSLGAWGVGGGIATLTLCVAAERLAPAPVAVVPAVLMPGAVGTLTAFNPSNIGWFVLVIFCGFLAIALAIVPGAIGWIAAVVTVVVLADRVGDGWLNWVAGTPVTFWACWAGRHRIGLIERVHRAEASAAAAEAATERQRLAGDLHDIVAHTLAVTVLHLGGARLALAHEPAEAEAGIAEAERLARRSMTELRRVVRVLAEDGADPHDPLAAPQPSAEDVPGLLEQYRSAGLTVSDEVAGDLAAVSGTTGLVLYRIVQEALANVSRHAPGQPVEVHVRVGADGAVAATISHPRPLAPTGAAASGCVPWPTGSGWWAGRSTPDRRIGSGRSGRSCRHDPGGARRRPGTRQSRSAHHFAAVCCRWRSSRSPSRRTWRSTRRRPASTYVPGCRCTSRSC